MVVTLMQEHAERWARENEETRQRQAGAMVGQHEFSLVAFATRTSRTSDHAATHVHIDATS